MGEQKWKDPIVEELHGVRKKLDKELERDPQGFMKKIQEKALKAGMKIAELKPATSRKSPLKKQVG